MQKGIYEKYLLESLDYVCHGILGTVDGESDL